MAAQFSTVLEKKRCSKCLKIKARTEFHRRHKSKDGLRPECKECRKAYQAANGHVPSIFGAHLYDSVMLVARAVPATLKIAKPGTLEFRAALRDELEKAKNVYLNNGLSSMTPENDGTRWFSRTSSNSR